MYKVKRFSVLNSAGKFVKGSKKANKELTKQWKHSHSSRLLKKSGDTYKDFGGNRGVNKFINDRADKLSTASKNFQNKMKSDGVMHRLDKDASVFKHHLMNSNSSKEAYSKLIKS